MREERGERTLPLHWLLLLCATLCYCSQWPVGVVQPEDAVMKCITSASQSWAWLATPPHNPPHSSYKPITHFSQPSTLLLQTSPTLLIALHTPPSSNKPLTHSSLSHKPLTHSSHKYFTHSSHNSFTHFLSVTSFHRLVKGVISVISVLLKVSQKI